MQLYALNYKKKVVFVEDAGRQQDYYCLECGGAVRVRGGHYRRNHFFHPSGSACKQNAKSIEHLQTQLFFKENLLGTVHLEQRFPAINRIADVVWESEKVIFEVQCSPITAEEVANRNRDYGSQGYHVVWILHDKTFNRSRLTAAEHYLRSQPHYFTDINAEGEGVIYDEHAEIKRGRRCNRTDRAFLNLVLKRTRQQGLRAKWPCQLEGTLQLPGKRAEPRNNMLKRWYYNLFQMLLESACR